MLYYYRKIDDYFLEDSRLNGPPTRRQDDRAHIRIPAKIVHGLGQNIWLLATHSWVNVFLPLVPFALVKSFQGEDGAKAFWLNYAALLGIFGLFRYGSEELSIPGLRKFGRIWDLTVGAFSLDLEIAIISLFHGYVELTKAYIVGKIVSNTLLTLSICFIVSGIRRGESHFNITAVGSITSLLATAIVPFGILAMFPSGFGGDLSSPPVLKFSRAAAAVLVSLFFLYQLFQKTHFHLFDTGTEGDSAPLDYRQNTKKSASRHGRLNKFVAVAAMLVAVAAAYFCSLPILSAPEAKNVPPEVFTGFCLLPTLAEIAEISQFARLSWDDRMDDAIMAAAGTSIQTALYISPILCFLGWALDQPMSLSLNLMEVVSFAISVWLFSYLVQDGKSNFLEGAMSFGLYIIQAAAFFLYGRR